MRKPILKYLILPTLFLGVIFSSSWPASPKLQRGELVQNLDSGKVVAFRSDVVGIVYADCDEETGEGCDEEPEPDEDEFVNEATEVEEENQVKECEEDCDPPPDPGDDPDNGGSCSYEDDTPECDWDAQEVCDIQVNCEGDRRRGGCHKEEGLCGYEGEGGDGGGEDVVCEDNGQVYCEDGYRVTKHSGSPDENGGCNYQYSKDDEKSDECFEQDPDDPERRIPADGKVVEEPIPVGGGEPGSPTCNRGWRKQAPECDGLQLYDRYLDLCTGEEYKTNYEESPYCGSGNYTPPQDAQCQDSGAVYYCDGKVCIEKRTAWNGESCAESFIQSSASNCLNSCLDNEIFSGENPLEPVNPELPPSHGGGNEDLQCRAQAGGSVYYCDGKSCIEKSSSWNGESCAESFRNVSEAYCGSCADNEVTSGEPEPPVPGVNFSPVTPTGEAYVGDRCNYTESCPDGGQRACHGGLREDGSCGYSGNRLSDCTECAERAPDLSNQESYCSAGKCAVPGVACLTDNDCPQPGGSCNYLQSCDDGSTQACRGKYTGEGSCEFAGASSCSACTTERIDPNSDQAYCEVGLCLNGPGKACASNNDCPQPQPPPVSRGASTSAKAEYDANLAQINILRGKLASIYNDPFYSSANGIGALDARDQAESGLGEQIYAQIKQLEARNPALAARVQSALYQEENERSNQLLAIYTAQEEAKARAAAFNSNQREIIQVATAGQGQPGEQARIQKVDEFDNTKFNGLLDSQIAIINSEPNAERRQALQEAFNSLQQGLETNAENRAVTENTLARLDVFNTNSQEILARFQQGESDESELMQELRRRQEQLIANENNPKLKEILIGTLEASFCRDIKSCSGDGVATYTNSCTGESQPVEDSSCGSGSPVTGAVAEALNIDPPVEEAAVETPSEELPAQAGSIPVISGIGDALGAAGRAIGGLFSGGEQVPPESVDCGEDVACQIDQAAIKAAEEERARQEPQPASIDAPGALNATGEFLSGPGWDYARCNGIPGVSLAVRTLFSDSCTEIDSSVAKIADSLGTSFNAGLTSGETFLGGPAQNEYCQQSLNYSRSAEGKEQRAELDSNCQLDSRSAAEKETAAREIFANKGTLNQALEAAGRAIDGGGTTDELGNTVLSEETRLRLIQMQEIAGGLGFDLNDPDMDWEGVQAKNFTKQAISKEPSLSRGFFEVLGLPMTDAQNELFARAVCREKYGARCDLSAQEPSTYSSLSAEDIDALNTQAQASFPGFTPADSDQMKGFADILANCTNRKTLNISCTDYVQTIVDPSRQSSGSELAGQMRDLDRQSIASQLGISVDEVKNLELTYRAQALAASQTVAKSKEVEIIKEQHDRVTTGVLLAPLNVVEPSHLTTVIGAGAKLSAVVAFAAKDGLRNRFYRATIKDGAPEVIEATYRVISSVPIGEPVSEAAVQSLRALGAGIEELADNALTPVAREVVDAVPINPIRLEDALDSLRPVLVDAKDAAPNLLASEPVVILPEATLSRSHYPAPVLLPDLVSEVAEDFTKTSDSLWDRLSSILSRETEELPFQPGTPLVRTADNPILDDAIRTADEADIPAVNVLADPPTFVDDANLPPAPIADTEVRVADALELADAQFAGRIIPDQSADEILPESLAEVFQPAPPTPVQALEKAFRENPLVQDAENWVEDTLTGFREFTQGQNPPVLQSLPISEQLATIDNLSAAVRRGEVTPELQDFWKGIVRDTDGRFEKYEGELSTSYYRGSQPTPDLEDPEIQKYITANINTRRAFLEGIEDGTYQDADPESFREWLISLHIKQAYKDSQVPGEITDRALSSNGSHTPVVFDDVARIARKYDDPYANFIDGPNRPGEGFALILDGISPSGWPKDEKVAFLPGFDSISHQYPDPSTFDDYLKMMQSHLQKAVDGKLTLPLREQLEEIAQFYQYSINARMFREVNQSLFMNMVNGMLVERGLKPIEHGMLDFIAMRLRPENFKKYFLDEIDRANPGQIAKAEAALKSAPASNNIPAQALPKDPVEAQAYKVYEDQFGPDWQDNLSEYLNTTIRSAGPDDPRRGFGFAETGGVNNSQDGLKGIEIIAHELNDENRIRAIVGDDVWNVMNQAARERGISVAQVANDYALRTEIGEAAYLILDLTAANGRILRADTGGVPTGFQKLIDVGYSEQDIVNLSRIWLENWNSVYTTKPTRYSGATSISNQYKNIPEFKSEGFADAIAVELKNRSGQPLDANDQFIWDSFNPEQKDLIKEIGEVILPPPASRDNIAPNIIPCPIITQNIFNIIPTAYAQAIDPCIPKAIDTANKKLGGLVDTAGKLVRINDPFWGMDIKFIQKADELSGYKFSNWLDQVLNEASNNLGGSHNGLGPTTYQLLRNLFNNSYYMEGLTNYFRTKIPQVSLPPVNPTFVLDQPKAQEAKAAIDTLQTSLKSGKIDQSTYKASVEQTLGLTTPLQKAPEASLLADDKLLTAQAITGQPSPESMFGDDAWVDWLNARNAARAHGDQPLTPEFIKDLEKRLNQKTSPIPDAKLQELSDWYNTRLPEAPDPYRLAAELQDKLFSLDDYSSDKLVLVLTNWSLESQGVYPVRLIKPLSASLSVNDLTKVIKEGSESFAKLEQRKATLETIGLIDQAEVLGLSKEKTFYNLVYSKYGKAALDPARPDTFLAIFKTEFEFFERSYRGPSAAGSAGLYGSIRAGGLVPESLIDLLTSKPKDYEALERYIRENYLDPNIPVYRGGVSKEAITTPEDVLKFFEEQKAIESSYFAVRGQSPVSTARVSDTQLRQSLERYNSLLVNDYLAQKGQGIKDALYNEIKTHANNPEIAIKSSPFTSTSIDKATSDGWAGYAFDEIPGGKNGVLITASPPYDGIIPTSSNITKYPNATVPALNGRRLSDHAGEYEVLIPGGIHPTSIEEVVVYNRDSRQTFSASKLIQYDGIYVTVSKIVDEDEVETFYKLNPQTGKYEPFQNLSKGCDLTSAPHSLAQSSNSNVLAVSVAPCPLEQPKSDIPLIGGLIDSGKDTLDSILNRFKPKPSALDDVIPEDLSAAEKLAKNQEAKAKLDTVQASYLSKEIDFPTYISSVEEVAGVSTPPQKVAESSLLIDDKFLVTGAISGNVPLERYFGEDAWVDWLSARVVAKSRTDQPLTIDLIKELHTQLTITTNPKIGGQLRTYDAIGGDYTNIGSPVKYSPEQAEAIRSNPILDFRQVGSDPDTGLIVYPDRLNKKSIEALPEDVQAGLGQFPNTTRIIEAHLNDLVDWYNAQLLDPTHDPYLLAAQLQQKLISVHPFNDVNGRVSRLLMDWSLEKEGLAPSSVLEPSDDIISTPQQWAGQVKAGSERYAQAEARSKLLQEIGISEPAEVLGLGEEKTFYDLVYSNTAKAPTLANVGDGLSHPEYEKFIQDFNSSFGEFKDQFMGPKTFSVNGSAKTINVGGLIPESYIKLLSSKPEDYEVLERYLREYYYSDLNVYRGGVTTDAIQSHDDVLKFFSEQKAIGSSYLAIGYTSPLSISKVTDPKIAQTLRKYNFLLANDYMAYKGISATPDTILREIDIHSNDPTTAVGRSPFASTSIDSYTSDTFARATNLAPNVKNGVLFTSKTPSYGAIPTFKDGGEYGIKAFEGNNLSKYGGEKEILLPGGVSPSAIDSIVVYDKEADLIYRASKITNDKGIYILIKDSSDNTTSYHLDPKTGQYEISDFVFIAPPDPLLSEKISAVTDMGQLYYVFNTPEIFENGLKIGNKNYTYWEITNLISQATWEAKNIYEVPKALGLRDKVREIISRESLDYWGSINLGDRIDNEVSKLYSKVKPGQESVHNLTTYLAPNGAIYNSRFAAPPGSYEINTSFHTDSLGGIRVTNVAVTDDIPDNVLLSFKQRIEAFSSKIEFNSVPRKNTLTSKILDANYQFNQQNSEFFGEIGHNIGKKLPFIKSGKFWGTLIGAESGVGALIFLSPLIGDNGFVEGATLINDQLNSFLQNILQYLP